MSTSNPSAGATPAAGGATPPQTPPPSGAGNDAGTPPATGASNDDQTLGETGLKALQAERTAAADWRKRAEKAEKDLKTAQEATLTDAERRDARLAELERKDSDHERERQEWQTRESVTTTALRLGFADPVDAFSLLDRAALEFDETTGRPKNVEKLLTDLLAAKPYLGGSSRPGGSFDGGPRGKPTTGQGMNDLIRRAAGRS